MDELRHIPIEMLVETDFPMRAVKTLSVEYRELVDSIKDVGILQPILVRPRGDKFEVVEGTHRWSAAKECKLATVPCLIQELTDDEVLSIQLQANAVSPATQRADFAERIHFLMEKKSLTLPQLCAMLHKSAPWVRSILLLRKLNHEAREMVNRGEIGVKSAGMLARLPARMQSAYLMQAATWPPDKFVELAREALKNFREYVKNGRTEHSETALMEPMPWLRQMRELHREAATCENAGTVISLMGGKTPIDGWRACLAWLLHLDPESVSKQFDKQEAILLERIDVLERRKLTRELRDNLITLRKTDD
jgi:ParB/RepB/Spo0J family partition protein